MKENLIIYDGECGFCNKLIIFIAKKDTDNNFKFVSNLSEFGKEILLEKDLFETSKTSIVVISEKSVFTKGNAIRYIFRNIVIHPILGIIIQITNLRFLNLCYSFVAKNRLLLSHGFCEIPPKEILSKFIMV